MLCFVKPDNPFFILPMHERGDFQGDPRIISFDDVKERLLQAATLPDMLF
jgi:hypothetical protein